MTSRRDLLNRIRYYSSVSLIYGVTLLLAWQILGPLHSSNPSTHASAEAAVFTDGNKPKALPEPKVSGKPVRIVITEADNELEVSLPVDEGYYDPQTQTWSITGWKAQFAMPSMPANDTRGNTLIYGHNNKDVFGRLVAMHPGQAIAKIYTDNNHVFTYSYQEAHDLNPNDVSVFTYDGPPVLVVQTCTGNWFELRRLYHFNFVSVT